jgi:hypothetical protein
VLCYGMAVSRIRAPSRADPPGSTRSADGPPAVVDGVPNIADATQLDQTDAWQFLEEELEGDPFESPGDSF